jgi:hypothetical protein
MSDDVAELNGDRPPETVVYAPTDAVGEPERGVDSAAHPPLARWIVWFAVSLGFVAFVALGRVHTYLGVKVKPTIVSISGFQAQKLDLNGREHIWRVWWRARHAVVDLGPGWGFTALMTTLTLLFIGLGILSIWVALVPEEAPAGGRQIADSDSFAPQ